MRRPPAPATCRWTVAFGPTFATGAPTSARVSSTCAGVSDETPGLGGGAGEVVALDVGDEVRGAR